jgi:uncharacterized membrane protein
MSRQQPSRKSRAAAAQPRTSSPVYWIAAVLALAGLADALYLTVLHLTGQSAVCGGAATCSQVLASPYSHFGPIPVAAFGLLGYFGVFSFAVFAAFRYPRAHLLFATVVGVMFAGTLWFLYVQAFILHQYCRFCLLSAAITFLLAGLVVATWPSQGTARP